MYRTRQIRIKKGHRLYSFCKNICAASARLYNRGNYLVRQYATACKRLEQGEELQENQRDAYEFIRFLTSGSRYEPKNAWLTYGQLDYILKASSDQTYRGLPAQANQQILKRILRSYKSFFQASKEYAKAPDRFTGRPHLPGYKKPGTLVTAVLTNQICRIRDGHYLKFPGTKDRLNIGKQAEDVRLKEVRIKPCSGCFVLDVVLEQADPETIRQNPLLELEETELRTYLKGMTDLRCRTAAIDPGMDNFCAVTNSFGARPFLIKGGVLKSENHYYNKKLAEWKSLAKKCNDLHSTSRIQRLHDRRNRIIKDQMHKISRRIVDWAEENRVDLVVMGHNTFQKQEIDMGHVNNQNFVQIPFHVFAGMLRYKLQEKGIAFLETEESYTSQADFLAMDPIPSYNKGEQPPVMSGKRIKRGLYRHGDQTISNADINGAANILRKVFPNLTEWDRGVVDTPYAVRAA